MTKYSKKPSFKVTGLDDVITEFALRLAALKDEHWLPSGTAVVIGSNLAITARHVITDFWDKHEYSPLSEGESEGTFSMVAGQFLDKGQTPLLWEVTRLWFSSITDVAFLRLSPASKEAANHVCTGVSMNLLPPRVGTRIAAFGYHSANIELSEEDDEQIIFEWNDSPTTSVGEVIQVHDERRDSVMLPFPCFQTNARFKHGMSGGPVFNDSGQLCGLICTSMDVSENETEHTSYAASLWPSMATQIDADRQGFPCGLTYPALELAQHGHITALGWERIRINKVADRTNVRILH